MMKRISYAGAVFMGLSFASATISRGQSVFETRQTPPMTANWQFPLQLEARVPFAPTAFPSGQENYLLYELILTNFSAKAIRLFKIEVVDADAANGTSIASFDAGQLRAMLQPLRKSASDPATKTDLAAGDSAIVFMAVVTDRKAFLPHQIAHRITTSDGATDGAMITTRKTTLQVLTAPVRGENWLLADGPGNEEDNHHRRGTIVLDGVLVDSRRLAIDWKQVKDGSSYSGDKRDVHSYFCFGQPVFAVADGKILMARDGFPNNIPGHGVDFHPAIQLDLDKAAGNAIVLDLGNGHFAYYMHLQSGSLRVKSGDRVKRGQQMASIGASGDAREPHLHFEVTNSPKALHGEGLPYVLDEYHVDTADGGASEIHHQDLPLNGSIIGFKR